MAMKKPYTWYLMEKHAKNSDGSNAELIIGGRVRVKGEKKMCEFKNIGYEVVDKVEVE